MNAVKSDTKKVFWKCGACSHTFFHLLNREFGCLKENEEKASDPLAGGLMKTGHQCGMLWGASLAVGAESFRRHTDQGQAVAKAITATQHILDSFINRAKTPDCLDITHCNLTTSSGMMKLMIKTILGGFIYSKCFNLAEKWAPEAIKSAVDGLSEKPSNTSQIQLSCASEVAKKMGANDEEMVTVAGFAGGYGLSGNACGALGAAIWMKTLDWCRKHPGKNPPYLNNKDLDRIIKTFHDTTGSEILCDKICGRRFRTIDDHSEFIKNGGCEKLIDVLARS